MFHQANGLWMSRRDPRQREKAKVVLSAAALIIMQLSRSSRSIPERRELASLVRETNLPGMRPYLRNPNPARWQKVRTRLERTGNTKLEA